MQESDYLKSSKTMVQNLRKFPGFELLSDEKLEEIVGVTRLQRYGVGEMIIKEGEYDNRVFFLIQGLVRVLKGDVELGTMRRIGDVFGEMGVIDGSPRSASVQAVQDSLVLAVDASCMDRISQESRLAFHAALYKVFSEKLSERLREMNAENIRLKELLMENHIPLPL